MSAISNPRRETFAVRRVMAIRSGETPEESYIQVFGEGSANQAKSRARKLLDSLDVKNRIAELEEQAARAAQIAKADEVVSKTAYDTLLWTAINTPPSQVGLDTPWADMTYDKHGEPLPMKPSVKGMMDTLGKSKNFLKAAESTVVLADWSPTKVRDVTPERERLGE